MPDISIVIPAYCEEKGISSVVRDIRRVMDVTGRSYETLVVDDGSDDETAGEAQGAGARILSHPYNIGNGAAVKTGIRNADDGIGGDIHGGSRIGTGGTAQIRPE